MAINYTYVFPGVVVGTSDNNMDILHYRITGVDTVTNNSYTEFGTISHAASSDTQDRNYNNLTFDVLLGWFEAYGDAAGKRLRVAQEIDKLNNPPSSFLPPVTIQDENETVAGIFNQAISGNLLDNNTPLSGITYFIQQIEISNTTYAVADGSPASVTTSEGTYTVAYNGDWSFTPATNHYGTTEPVTYTVGSSNNDTKVSNLFINTTFVPTVASDVSFTGNYNAPVNGNLLTVVTPNFGTSGVDRRITNVVIASENINLALPETPSTDLNFSTAQGSWIFNANGNFQFSPVTGYTGSVPDVVYSAIVGIGVGAGTDTGTLSISDISAP